MNLQIDMVPLPTKKANYKAEPLPKEPQGMPFPLTCVDRLDNHVTSYLMLVGEHAFGKPGGWRQQSEIVDGLNKPLRSRRQIAPISIVVAGRPERRVNVLCGQ